MRIAIIGAGVMGSAFARAWTRPHTKTFGEGIKHILVAPKNLTVCDPDAKKLAPLKREIGITISSDSRSAVARAGVILLAVKPQQIYAALGVLQPVLEKNQLIISIAAGVTIRSIETILGRRHTIVRAMPNLPLTINEGITAWCANRAVNRAQKRIAQNFLSAGAMTCEVKESQLNAVTALSAVGQGVLYTFMALLLEEIVILRVPRAVADQLVRTTIAGAARLLQRTAQTAQELAAHVATKGGITEAALKSVQRDHFNRLIAHAVRAAYVRAQELSR